MIQIRRSEERGAVDWGWLKSKHTFSFGEYYDSRFMGFRDIRVINDDFIEPGRGFGTHPHKDMEIITYVYEGGVLHKDNLGHQNLIRAGEIQRMSAGYGIEHSEYNSSIVEPLRLLQIWILPQKLNIDPGYEQISLNEKDRKGKLQLMVSPDGREKTLKIHQDVNIYSSIVEPNQELNQPLDFNRHSWVQIIRGKVYINGQELDEGDGAGLSNENQLTLKATHESEILFFDLN